MPGFKGRCMSSAMGILPHTDVDRALEIALSVDVPFWPQLPHLNFYEDMYVQFSEHFPGVVLDEANQRITVDTRLFYDQLADYVDKSANPETFALSPKYTATLRKFLERDLSKFPAIKGQVIGPISFGLQIVDENRKAIIYNDEIRTLLFDFTRAKINHQYRLLRAKHPNPIVFFDEPGLELVFSSVSGYTNEMAKEDLAGLLAGIDGMKGIHLCGNPDWDFLLAADIDILSFDSYSRGDTFVRYDRAAEFLERGGILSWGIVPTGSWVLERETEDTLLAKLEGFWDYLEARGVSRQIMVENAMITPATCSLVGERNVETVEAAFRVLGRMADRLRRKYFPEDLGEKTWR